MNDTQWPRYEVFLQETPGKPHVHAGSVHATDPEIALLNARDVFVRRPDCASLWVAPAEAITEAAGGAASPGRSAERRPNGSGRVSNLRSYLVFGKLEPKSALTHLGEVSGNSGDDAVSAAQTTFSDRRPIRLWLIPEQRVERSREADAGAMFEPARHKPFRDQAFYRIQTALRKLRVGAGRER